MARKPRKNPAAVALGRLGGQVKSAAKAAAARENGKKPKRRFAKRAGKLLLILAVLAVGCASPTTPTPTATLEARGELTLTCDDNSCRFTGVAVNSGPSCAAQVAGTVAFRVIGQQAPQSQAAITVDSAVIAPGEFTYSGEVSKKAIVALLPMQWYTSTAFTWHNVGC